MPAGRSLPVLMPVIAGQRWSCHSCGNCCRSLVGHLTEDERRGLDGHSWEAELGAVPYVRAGRGWALNKRADGACVFLDPDNRCRIHARFGEPAKPLACRIFPFSVRPTNHGWQASLRFDCPSVVSSSGEPIAHHRTWLGQLATALDHDQEARTEVVKLQGSIHADEEEVESILGHLEKWFETNDRSMTARLIGAARLTSTLDAARLGAVRGPRFNDLLDLMFQTLPGECRAVPLSPTPRQSAMLRQYAFAHAEHVTLFELRSGLRARTAKRWRQLTSARRFLKGHGTAPPLPGLEGEATFEKIDAVRASAEREAEVGDLLRRYVLARLAGRSVFGDGFYGWSIPRGLAACWLSIAAAGWLSRYRAAAAGRDTLTFDDVGGALGIVDRAATRSPALGALAERARGAYLLGDDGIARLLQRYALLGTPG